MLGNIGWNFGNKSWSVEWDEKLALCAAHRDCIQAKYGIMFNTLAFWQCLSALHIVPPEWGDEMQTGRCRERVGKTYSGDHWWGQVPIWLLSYILTQERLIPSHHKAAIPSRHMPHYPLPSPVPLLYTKLGVHFYTPAGSSLYIAKITENQMRFLISVDFY